MRINSETTRAENDSIEYAYGRLGNAGFNAGCVVYRNRADVLLARAVLLTSSFKAAVHGVLASNEHYIVIRGQDLNDINLIRNKVEQMRDIALGPAV